MLRKKKAMDFEIGAKQRKEGRDYGLEEERMPRMSFSSRIRRNFFFILFITILKSLNPDAYSRLSVQKLRDSITYLFKLVFIMLLISFILLIPRFAAMHTTSVETLSEFSKLKLDIQAEKPTLPLGALGPFSSAFDSSINISKGVNYSDAKFEEYDFIISNEGIFRKPMACMLWKPICYLYSSEERTVKIGGPEFFNVLQHREEYAALLRTLMLMLLPYFFIIMFVLFSIKYILLILLLSLLTFLAYRGLKHKPSFKKILNTAIYSSTIMVILQTLSFALGFLKGILIYLPYALYLLFFIIGIILLQENY